MLSTCRVPGCVKAQYLPHTWVCKSSVPAVYQHVHGFGSTSLFLFQPPRARPCLALQVGSLV